MTFDSHLVQSFAEEQLHPQAPHEPRSAADASALIFSVLTRGSFRRTALDDASAADVRKKIQSHVAEGSPVSVTVPFGGYKNHRTESFPSPDWAEVFNINYVARYLLPIANMYSPGAVALYTYSADVMDLVSNIPLAATRQYADTFQRLLGIFSSHLPPNLSLRLFDVSQQYERAALLAELRSNYEDNREHWHVKFTEEERIRRVHSAERNLMPNGVHDLRGLSDADWTARCVEAAMWCEALDSLSLRRQFNKYSEHIQVVFVRGPSLSVHIGSCDTGAHHFWAGTGVVAQRRERLLQAIMSQPKVDTLRSEGHLESVAVSTVLDELGTMFQALTVLPASH